MLINESIGIPDGLNEMAMKLKGEIISDLREMSSIILPKEDEPVLMLLNSYNINIGSISEEEMPLYLEFKLRENVNGAKFIKAGYDRKIDKVDFIKNRMKYINKPNSSSITITLSVNDKTQIEDIINELNKPRTNSILAHELMHFYDSHKRGGVLDFDEHTLYVSYKLNIDLEPIKLFSKALYFVSPLENTVRPSEMYQSLIDNNIKKSEFLDYLKSTKTFSLLKYAKDFKFENFKNDIESDPDLEIVKGDLENRGFKFSDNVVEDILELIVQNIIINIKKNAKMGILGKDGGDIFSKVLNSAKQSEIDSKYKKFENNPHLFFKWAEKKLNKNGDSMIRQLSKLISLIEDDTKDDYSKEIHRKINARSLNENILSFRDYIKIHS